MLRVHFDETTGIVTMIQDADVSEASENSFTVEEWTAQDGIPFVNERRDGVVWVTAEEGTT